jgi:hypothetical protein
MNVPNGKYVSRAEVDFWDDAAKRMRLQYGIYVEAGYEYLSYSSSLVTRIYFKLGEREFECLNDLETALRNKAFL